MPSEITQKESSGRVMVGVFDSAPTRLLATVLLLTAAPVSAAFSATTLWNADIWWHLRSGLWILQNHAFPRTGLFSQYVDRGWVDSSWGFDVLTAITYKLLDLRAFAALLMGFKLALAVVTFVVARGRSGRFWYGIVLSGIAQYVITDLLLRPILVSILFFGVELFLLLKSHRCNDMRPLSFLPVLFLLWANLDGQFLIGLILLSLFVTAEVSEFLLNRFGVISFSASTDSLTKVLAISGLSALATLFTPYPFQLFSSAFQSAYGRVIFEDFQEMQAMDFRRPQHFVLMLLVMMAFVALGRQRSRDLFKLSAIILFVALAFRVQRDVWCVVFVAIAIIADAAVGWHRSSEPEVRHRSAAWTWEKPLVAVIIALIFLVAIVRLPGNVELMSQAGRVFPIKACDFIRSNQLPGPVFNAYYWGGFLMWYLPEYPVSIDSRVSLYGDVINKRYFKVTGGTERLETDPTFDRSRIILFERNSAVIKALTTLPALRDQFRVAYQDNVATVLVRQQ